MVHEDDLCNIIRTFFHWFVDSYDELVINVMAKDVIKLIIW